MNVLINMEYKRCYIYEPSDEKPAKRHCLNPATGLHSTWSVRRKLFEEQWATLNDKIEEALAAANDNAAQRIRDFIDIARSSRQVSKLPACVVAAEPGSRAKDVLTSLIFNNASPQERHSILNAGDAPDLKSALKKIIRELTDSTFDEEAEDEEERPRRHRTNVLAYDLQPLADEIDDISQEQCVIVIPDAEAFKPDVLSELLEYLTLWLNRIPFVLVLCCAVPIYMLQQSLSQRALRILHSEVIHAASRQDELEIVLERTTNSSWRHLYVGPQLMRSFLQRQHDYLTSVSTFVSSLKYATMAAHYANPLIALHILTANQKHDGLCRALRTTASFKAQISKLVESGEMDMAAKLLDNDKAMMQQVQKEVIRNTGLLRHMFRIIHMVAQVYKLVLPEKEALVSSLWLQCLSGTLKRSTALRHLYLGLRKAPASLIDEVVQCLEHASNQIDDDDDDSNDYVQKLKEQLEALRRAAGAGAKSTTTNGSMSCQSALANWAEEYLNGLLEDPRTMLYHEIFLYDSVSPCREVLTPRPRHAIERALSSPHDYLDCDCCAPEHVEEEASLSATQPATAVLYQLYLESGNMLNVHDLWQAFSAIMGDDRGDELKMALFQRSLADLRHLGMVKSTRRRVDHIAKTAWKGL